MRFGKHAFGHKGHRGFGPDMRGCVPPRGRWSRGPFEVSWEIDAGPRGRGRRGKVFDGGELRLVLLKLIADEPRHGYDVIRAIEERTGGAYAPSPGIVYPTLTLLEDMDHIAEQKSEGAKKKFAATKAGEDHLAEHQDKVAALLARLDAMGEERARADSHSVRRAMRNLREVLLNRLSEDQGDEFVHRAVEIIDEAARNIERLN